MGGSTSKGGNMSGSTGAPTTGTSTISGSLAFDTGSAAECASMQTANGTAAMKEVLSAASGVTNMDNIAATVTCGARRRLSDGRRLSGSKANVAYTITIPAGSSATAAGNAKSQLAAMTPAQWTSSIQSKMAAKGITVAVSNMVATAPTVTTTSNVSFAASMFSVGAAGIFAWLILALQ